MADPQRVAVFVSHSGKDPYWRQKIVSALQQPDVEVLYDSDSSGDGAWNPGLRDMRERARIAVLIVSPAFLESPRIQSEELPHLFDLRRSKGLPLVAVLIENSSWQKIPELREGQVFPEDGRPLFRHEEMRLQLEMQKLAAKVSGIAAEFINASTTSQTVQSGKAWVKAPAITISFGADRIPLGRTTTLTFTITNPNSNIGLTGIAFTDDLPDGLVVSSSNDVKASCLGLLVAAPGASSISLKALSLPSSASCTISVSVTAVTAGVKNNSVTVVSLEGGTGNTSIASITVIATQPESVDGTSQSDLVRALALELIIERPDGTAVNAMASLIAPSLALTSYQLFGDFGLTDSGNVKIHVEAPRDSSGDAWTTMAATIRGVDKPNNIVLLALNSEVPFKLPDGLLPDVKVTPAGQWNSCVSTNIRKMRPVQGRFGGLLEWEGYDYQALYLDTKIEVDHAVSGAPIIWNNHLVAIAARSTGEPFWQATRISRAAVDGLIKASDKRGKQTDWLDQATIDRFSDDLRLIISLADQIRTRLDATKIETEDVLRALFEKEGSQLAALFVGSAREWARIITSRIRTDLEGYGEPPIAEFKGIPPISGGVRRAIIIARDKANERGTSTPIEEAHLTYGLLSLTGDKPVQMLRDMGITPDKVKLPGQEKPEARKSDALAGYKSDDPAGEDLLDLKKEVNALASVMAAKDVEPPLSLGLFGDWGSGKSFFMRQLERRICELQEDAQNSDGKSSYCEDIVQLTFNAWTYIDTDLWANLASGIFEGLAAEMAKKRGGDSQAERALALAAASSSQLVLAEAEKQKQKAEEKLKQFEEHVAKLQETESTLEAKLNPKELLIQATQFALEQKEVQGYIANAAKQLHIEEAKAIGGQLNSEILELRGIWSTLLYTMRNNERLWLWIIAFLVALGLGWGSSLLLKKLNVNEITAHVIALLTSVSGLLAPFLMIARKALSFIQKARASQQKHIHQARQVKAAELEQEKQKIHEEVEKAQKAVNEAAENVKKLNDQLEKMRADRKLADYIRQRNESSDYSQHLGVIARVRSDFRQLSILLRDVKEESEKEAAEIKRRQEENDDTRKLFPRIDRIILYIDDLDRCPEKNVVEVLQAVHLLLAFPLFVVVVGVDPRWLLHSLRQHSNAFQADTQKNENLEPEEDVQWESTPMNYLEKIFQIPFTLRPLGKTGFGRFVDTFATTKERTEEKKTDQTSAPVVAAKNPEAQSIQALSAAAASGLGGQSGTIVPPPLSAPKPQEDVAPIPTQPHADQVLSAQQPVPLPVQQQATAAPTPAEPIDRHPEHLRIEEWERTFMKTLHELIPSPRASKRFINIYRLLRASLDDNEHDRFVGNEKQGGDYQCAQLLLAILTGYPAEAAELLGALIGKKSAGTWGDFINTFKTRIQSQPTGRNQDKNVKDEKPVTPANNSGALELTAAEIQRWPDLLAKLDRLGENNLYKRSCSTFADWAPRVARYSFQSGRVILLQRS